MVHSSAGHLQPVGALSIFALEFRAQFIYLGGSTPVVARSPVDVAELLVSTPVYLSLHRAHLVQIWDTPHLTPHLRPLC